MTFLRSHVDDYAYLVGSILVVAGISLFSIPAGLIVAGAMCIAAAYLLGGD